jgi:hypothetical protein
MVYSNWVEEYNGTFLTGKAGKGVRKFVGVG